MSTDCTLSVLSKHLPLIRDRISRRLKRTVAQIAVFNTFTAMSMRSRSSENQIFRRITEEDHINGVALEDVDESTGDREAIVLILTLTIHHDNTTPVSHDGSSGYGAPRHFARYLLIAALGSSHPVHHFDGQNISFQRPYNAQDRFS